MFPCLRYTLLLSLSLSFFLIPLILTCILQAAFKVIVTLTLTYQLTFQKEPHKIDTEKGVKESEAQNNINIFRGSSTLYLSENVFPCPLEHYARLSGGTELGHVKY